MWSKHTTYLLVASAAAAAVAFVAAVSVFELKHMCECMCICLTVCFADQRPPQIILLIKPTHTYEQHLLDAAHKYSFAHAAYAQHMCAETENFSSKTCYFWGTDAHSCTFIHRSIIARAKQWTTKTKSIAMCSMWMWKDLKQKCHCAHHIHQKWKCSMSITVANDMVRSPHFPLRESKNSSMKIARLIMLIISAVGKEDQK